MVATTCPYCGVGCGVSAKQADDATVSVEGLKAHPANLGKLCSKGAALGETTSLDGRLLKPQMHDKDVSWDIALTEVAQRFSKIIDEHGPDAVAFYVSGQLLTEDYYVANKLMKGFIGSANIDTNSRLCMSSAVAGYKRAFGSDTVPGCYEDLALADVVVITGSNFAWCHPILFQRVLAAKRAHPHKRIVVIDPRKTATAEQADLHLPVKPGTDVLLFNGLLHYLQQNGHADERFIAEHCNGVEGSINAAAEASDTAWVANQCDVAEEQLIAFYELFANTEKVMTVFSMGINQSTSGTDKVNAITNCHLYSGKIGKPGATPFSITGQPNAMGGREVGGLANMLAAHMALEEPEHRELVQDFWGSPHIADKVGLKAVDLFERVHDGTVKAVWVMATNPAVSLPNASKVNEALAKCEFLVVSDVVAATDTTRHADVLLPAAAWGEKDGTVTNSERRISRQRGFIPCPALVKPDWWIISQVATKMGFGDAFTYSGPHEIFAEHAALSAYQNTGQRDFDISGVLPTLLGSQFDAALPLKAAELAQLTVSQGVYNRLQATQWPIVANQTASDSQRFFANGRFYTKDQKACLIPVTWQLPKYQCTAQYPLIFNSGRVRDHWHTMTRTGKSQRLSSHIVEPFIAMHPADAEAYGVQDQSLATVSSSWGQVVLKVSIDEAQRRGEVFAPIHWSDQFSFNAVVGQVVNPVVDPVSSQPEFKHTPVNIKPLVAAQQGFALSRDALDTAGFSYWTKAVGEQFERYEISLIDAPENVETIESQLSALLGVQDVDDVLFYADQHTASYRMAVLRQGALQACIYLSSTGEVPERSWLSSLFVEGNLDDATRAALLLGQSPDPSADVGALVCSCFGVGKNTICQAIKDKQLCSVAAIGDTLKAGTNCGSCVPELTALLAEEVSQ